MYMEPLLASCPDYAKDLKLNLSSLLRQNELTEQQTWGIAVCSAIVSRNPHVLQAILLEAEKRLSPEANERGESRRGDGDEQRVFCTSPVTKNTTRFPRACA
jgi:alkyl hydroperoxide reductase subunit D